MRLLKIYSLLLILLLSVGSCVKLLEPEDDNHLTFNIVYSDPSRAQGLLMYGYTLLPTNSLSFNDVATDDAVSNNLINTYHRMAIGEWSAIYNPVNLWDNCIKGILSVNQFIDIIDSVHWSFDPQVTFGYRKRFKGEAYALRGILEFHLLQTVGGLGTDGQLLGIPIYDEFLNINDDWNIPRATFTESINHIYADLNKALTYLTMNDYLNITAASQLPPGLESVSVANYNTVFGNTYTQRISGRTVKAYLARVALLVASPAFNSTNDVTLWQSAANYAATPLNLIGGIAGLDPNGHRFYDATRVNALNAASDPPLDQREMIWRKPIVTSNSREGDNFPPSLFGNGNVNPTQNLVDAFPMKNGYPISTTDTSISHYNLAKPYATTGVAARDPRLALYIAYNGCIMKNTTILTGIGGGVNAKDSTLTSTRTGYYLRKLLREDVNYNPAARNTQKHYEVHMRYTELFLIYAEAANEAWGPDGTGLNTFSARDVIRAIRKRAGITQLDNYVNSITSKEDMRTLIRNERRLELCFEGFRFWDLRRWKADLTVTAKGVNINKAGTVFSVVDVEQRVYDNNFMIYGPIPANEVLKYNALVQNNGW